MHYHFNSSATDILWTLTFAALLVLLVVLLGRDRARRFPWFTAVTVMMALRMVTSKLLSQRLAPVVFNEVFLALYDLTVVLSLGLAVEIARRAFKGAGRVAWIAGTLVVLAVGGFVMVKWGPWPAWKTLTAGSHFSNLRFMQLFAQKADLLANMLFIQLGLLVVFFGRRFHAGWRSHTQQIAIGLSTSAIAQSAMRLIWQEIGKHTTIHSQAEYAHVMSIEEKLFSASNAIYLAVLLWWIACLWVDEPGGANAVNAGVGAEAAAVSNGTDELSSETGVPPTNAGEESHDASAVDSSSGATEENRDRPATN
jgi:hypothetical protein